MKTLPLLLCLFVLFVPWPPRPQYTAAFRPRPAAVRSHWQASPWPNTLRRIAVPFTSLRSEEAK